MKADERKTALEWLADNTDKWKQDIDFEWLVPNPEEIVPEYVFAYLEQEKEGEEYLDRLCDMLDSMGLNDF